MRTFLCHSIIFLCCGAFCESLKWTHGFSGAITGLILSMMLLIIFGLPYAGLLYLGKLILRNSPATPLQKHILLALPLTCWLVHSQQAFLSLQPHRDFRNHLFMDYFNEMTMKNKIDRFYFEGGFDPHFIFTLPASPEEIDRLLEKRDYKYRETLERSSLIRADFYIDLPKNTSGFTVHEGSDIINIFYSQENERCIIEVINY